MFQLASIHSWEQQLNQNALKMQSSQTAACLLRRILPCTLSDAMMLVVKFADKMQLGIIQPPTMLIPQTQFDYQLESWGRHSIEIRGRTCLHIAYNEKLCRHHVLQWRAFTVHFRFLVIATSHSRLSLHERRIRASIDAAPIILNQGNTELTLFKACSEYVEVMSFDASHLSDMVLFCLCMNIQS